MEITISDSEYLNHDNMHCKPLNVRVHNSALYVSTWLYQHSSQEAFHGYIVRFFSRVALISGTVLTIPTALIETLASGIFGLTGYTVFVLAGYKSEVFQKYTLKSLSYSLHSALSLIFCMVILLRLRDHKSHAINTFIQAGIYLVSAIAIQTSIANKMDRVAGRIFHPLGSFSVDDHWAFAGRRIINLFLDNHRTFIEDLQYALVRDLGYENELTRNLGQIADTLDDFWIRHPEHQDFLQNFSLESIRNSENHPRWRHLLMDLLSDAGVIQNVVDDESLIYLHDYSNEESNYQNFLFATVKNAFIKLYHREDLVKYLSNTQSIEEGRENLTSLDGAIFIPVAYFAQIEELESDENRCPIFSSVNLLRYQDRKQNLNAAREIFRTLTSEEKDALLQKLLIGGDFNPEGLELSSRNKIQPLYSKVTDLASSLHQGTLMSRSTIDLANYEVSDLNLFGKACREASTSDQLTSSTLPH